MNLDKGIFLEDSSTLLPWGASERELRLLASPQVSKANSDRITLYWNDRICLDGLAGGISADFDYRYSKGPNFGGHFRMAVFSPKGAFDGPRALFEQYLLHFTNRLGPPTDTESVGGYDFPYAEWDRAEVFLVLMVFSRFGEYCIVEVWRKPLPEWRRPNKSVDRSNDVPVTALAKQPPRQSRGAGHLNR